MALGFGIVGCGMIANFHAKAIAEIDDAKLVACFDHVADARDKLAGATGCKAYADIDQFMADSDIDIVTICTPSGAHLEPGILAAKAHKHVLVEKPLEVTLDRCDKLIAACESNGVVLSTIFQSRFHRSSKWMKQAVEQNRFGRVTLADAYVKWFRDQEYYDSGQWRGTWRLDGGGALMNQAIHSVDLLIWLMGPVVSVTAQSATLAHQRIEVEDTIVATLKFASGALGVIEASTATYPGSLKKVELHGSQGSAIMEEEDLIKWEFSNPDQMDDAIVAEMHNQNSSGGGASDPSAISFAGHVAQFKDVIDAIKSDRKPLIDGHQGRRSVEVILAIYQAAQTGELVKLPLKTDPELSSIPAS